MVASQPISLGTLSREEAAAYIGFDIKTFNMWVRRGLLPPADPATGGWTKAALDEAIERVKRDGIQNDNPSRRHSHFVKIYNAQRIWKQGDGPGHWLFYFRPTSERLPGPWGSPEFMSALIECEHRYAAQQLAANPSGSSRAQAHNQSPYTAQLCPAAPPNPPKSVTQFVTQKSVDRRHESPAGGFVKILRRRSQITQADIARIIRAAKQAGAAEVEVRLPQQSTIVIRLQPSAAPDIPLAPSEEIVL